MEARLKEKKPGTTGAATGPETSADTLPVGFSPGLDYGSDVTFSTVTTGGRRQLSGSMATPGSSMKIVTQLPAEPDWSAVGPLASAGDATDRVAIPMIINPIAIALILVRFSFIGDFSPTQRDRGHEIGVPSVDISGIIFFR